MVVLCKLWLQGLQPGGGGDATAEGGRDDLETDETLTIATGGPILQ